MTIKRVFGDEEVEITLSFEEMYDAYCEVELRFDMDAISNYFDCFDDEELMQSFGKNRKDIEVFIEEIATELRRNINKYDMDYCYALDDAVKSVLINNA